MSSITIPQNARPGVRINERLRNTLGPVAEHQNVLADRVGAAAYLRPKMLFHNFGGLVSGGASLIPAGGAGTQPRWRFAWRSGPYALFVRIRIVMASSNQSGTNPYAKVTVRDVNSTIVATATMYFGATATVVSDVPTNFGIGYAGLLNDDGDPYYLSPSTDYFAEISGVDYGRIHSISIHEYSYEPSTEAGYPAIGAASGSPIYDEDRAVPARMARKLWQGGQQLWNWSVNRCNADEISLTTYTNVIDGTSTAVGATTPGVQLVLDRRGTIGRPLGVPVVMRVYASASASLGQVRLLDSGGATVLACTINSVVASWYHVTGYLPASTGTYYLFAGASSGNTRCSAISLYEGVAADTYNTNGGVRFITAGRISTTRGGDLDVEGPTPQINDIELLILANRNQSISFSAPDGFVAVADSPQTSAIASYGSIKLAVYWKRASSTVPSAVTIDPAGGSSTEPQHAVILLFRGATTAGNPWDVTAGFGASAVSDPVKAPSDTTTVSGCLLVAAVACASDEGIQVQPAEWTNSSVQGLTSRVETHNVDGVSDNRGVAFGVATGFLPVSTGFNDTLTALTGPASHCGLTITLKP